ncbi:helix-turn-helix domain-containing protein [Paenibacillus ihuae]|uniref:helix-turn-helix domain-containing protein n=1 Tax=Paenibacillus ihuae TaxID=1232431 RepID=UPI0006D58F4D|nr:helix-turn-helix transcriptional regulator [Paenibacillus ihuae]
MFSKRLKQLRKARNFTIQEVADTIGVAKSTYSGYESGFRQPTLDAVQIIAKKLNTTADYLLGLTEYPDVIEPSNNAKELLNLEQLHWDGIPLEREDLLLVKSILEHVIQTRAGKDGNKK